MNISFLRSRVFHLAALTLLIVLLLLFYNGRAPQAEDNESASSNGKAFKAAIVDVEAVFKEAKVFIDIQSQIEGKANNLQEKATATQEDLQKRHQDLESQKTALSQSAYDSKMQALKDEFEKISRETYKEKLSIDHAYKKALKEVDDNFSDMITNYSKKNGIHIIFNKSQTVYSDDALDITDDVMGMLNSAMPSYSVTFEVVEDIDS